MLRLGALAASILDGYARDAAGDLPRLRGGAGGLRLAAGLQPGGAPRHAPSTLRNTHAAPPSPQRFLTYDLDSGESLNRTLCPQQWAWARLRVNRLVTYTQLRRTGAVWEETPVTEYIPHSASVTLSADYDFDRGQYNSLSLLVVNGTPPDYAKAEPYAPVEYSVLAHAYAEVTDRETLALGYNITSEYGCQEPLADYVYMGVRCLTLVGTAGVPGVPCFFNLTATALPHKLYDGLDLVAHIKPDWRAHSRKVAPH